MRHPAIQTEHPSFVLAVVGGAFGAVLLAATLAVAEGLGGPAVDLPLLAGRLFAQDAEGAIGPGYWVVGLLYILVLAPAFALIWPHLPGPTRTFAGALIRAALVALALTVVSGLALALTASPGAFALGAGVLGPVVLFIAHLLYALAVALVGVMPQGLAVMDLPGWSWTSHGSGESP